MTEAPPPQAQPKAVFVYHPHELVLKGKNRPQFERSLSSCLRTQAKEAGVNVISVERRAQRYFLTVPEDQTEQIEEMSKKVFGMANYARCYIVERDIEKLKQVLLDHIKREHSINPIQSFKVDTSRVDKRYEKTSMEISKEIGGHIHDNAQIPVDIHHPKKLIHIEVLNESFLYFFDRKPGAHGLPLNTAGKIICLLSGGPHSTAAAWYLMRRGATLKFLHFHTEPEAKFQESIDKVKAVIDELAKWGGRKQMFAVSIWEQLQKINEKVPERLVPVITERMVGMIAKGIVEKKKFQAIAVGDTMNKPIGVMQAVQNAVAPMLIFKPMLGWSEEQIMERIAIIGTSEIHTRDAPDSLHCFETRDPEILPNMEEVLRIETELDMPEMVRNAVRNIKNLNWGQDK